MKIVKMSALHPDATNTNQHTQRGRTVVETSQRQRGFARPGLVAKNGGMIAGNLSVTDVGAEVFGPDEVIVIETWGDVPIVHKRMDIPHEDTDEAKLLQVEDNRASELSLAYDAERMLALTDRGVNLDHLFAENEYADILAMLPEDEQWAQSLGVLSTDERNPYRDMKFLLHIDQTETIQAALKLAREQGPFEGENPNSNGNALHRVAEWYIVDE